MGADYFVIKGCNIQSTLGADGFCAAIKQRAQIATLEAQREEIERATGKSLDDLELVVAGTNRADRRTSVRELRVMTSALADTQECVACPLAGDTPLGCYRYVTYPLEERFEELLFEYFVASLESGEPEYTIGKRRDGGIVTAAGTLLEFVLVVLDGAVLRGWEQQRGRAEQGGLAARGAPLTAKLQTGTVLSSAQVLAVAFAAAIDGKSALSLYAHFFRGFVRHLERKGVALDTRNLVEVSKLADLLQAATKEPSVEVRIDS